jgi:branched-chain amino acid transport system permease protein
MSQRTWFTSRYRRASALAGALAARFKNSGDPTIHFDVIEMSGDALLATIIGGMGTLAGPLYGFTFQRVLDEMLGGTIGLVGWIETSFPGVVESSLVFGVTVQDLLNNSFQGFAGFYVGMVFILFVLYVPGGFLGTARTLVGGPLATAFPDWVGRRLAALRRLLGDRR